MNYVLDFGGDQKNMLHVYGILPSRPVPSFEDFIQPTDITKDKTLKSNPFVINDAEIHLNTFDKEDASGTVLTFKAKSVGSK